MSGRNASSTAFGALIMRAAHQLVDARPLILEDPAALTLLGEEQTRKIENSSAHHRTAEARALRAHVVLRSRFAEDRLAEAASRGIKQYVLLGAGFDTFAFRQPAWARSIKIIEVDHPASQARKKALLSDAGMALPPNLLFADVDFERESLAEGLKRHAVSFAESTFFSWLGVTMYLREEAVDSVLGTIVKFPAASEIVFTFAQPSQSFTGVEISLHSSLSKVVADLGSHLSATLPLPRSKQNCTRRVLVS
jgi:methyltransferase (TIGR00027 family)